MSFAPADLPTDLPNFVALLQARASQQALGSEGGFAFLGDGDVSPESTLGGGCTRWNFVDLDLRARSIAATLQAGSLSGERVLLLYPPGLDFLAAFCGCLYAGVVAVPAYLPRSDRALPRLRGIVADSSPRAVMTLEAMLGDADRWAAAIPELQQASRLASDSVPASLAESWLDPQSNRDTLAFLQYTSGSTADAKGVMVSHGNLLSNSAVIQRSFGSDRASRGVSWLPLHHDMGLIGGALQTIYCGGSSTLFSPVAFLQRPVRWLELISRTGATISGGPNFAYDLCVRRVTAEQKATLDLSRWAVAFNGAEPVRADTIDRFATAFATCGFRREAFLPCYGLAEATLIVSGGPPLLSPRIARVDPQDIERGTITPVVPITAEPIKILVGSGQTDADHRVEIVDPERLSIQPDQQVGEVWVSGPSVAQGYWNQTEATEATFGATLTDDSSSSRFLRTGDLGFVRDGELFVTGRLKDLIIVRGRNVYPQDVEWTVGHAHSGVAADAWAAFAVEVNGEDRLVVVGEVDRRTKDFAEVIATIRTAVATEFDLDLHAVVLLKPMTLPRTSSGKVRRRAIRDQFETGTLGGVVEWVADKVQVDARSPAIVPVVTASGSHTAPSSVTITAWLVDKLAGPLGISPNEVDPMRPFSTFGLGSLRAVGLAGELEVWLGRSLSPTLLYEYPTVDKLARYLASDSASIPAVEQTALSTHPRVDDDRVAIIGIGCRFPGASGPEAYWNLLRNGIDAVGPVSVERRADFTAPESTRAGFLDRVDLFDAAFFGIAPREAVWVDPQQRLLLEVAWEALEDGGLVPEQLAGSAVGVFVGISTDDYARLHGGSSREGAGDAYALTGNAASIAANRLSYTFDFRGPSLAVDTACSSSLVAIQLACRSLLAGESAVALAGGVNLILAPELLANFAAAGFLAPDARCKTFDASADGYVRGEGAGVVVLKPLAQALADGDPIRAVIRSGAINQDGRSNGLTAPSREAQEAVLRSAFTRSGVEPAQLDYIEAHGTGTLLGDPIEARALGAVLAEGRPNGDPCWVGSAKTNIGHLEAAAGVAGLIKVALALEHGSIPPSLHFHKPNPHIPFADLPIAVASRLTPWPMGRPTRLAGVSAFGFGGTNAHLVLEAITPVVDSDLLVSSVENSAAVLLPISAQTGSALAASARAIRDRLASGTLNLADAAFTAGTRRTHFEHRLAIVATSATEAVALLEAAERGEIGPGIASGRVLPGRRPKIAFVFSGQGSQWLGMARDLLPVPAFRAAVERVDRMVVALSGWSVLSALAIEEEDIRLLEPEIAQPLQFAVHIGLAALWRSWGIEPDAVVGHSLGEVAAAYLAGAIPLADAVRLIILRGRLTQRTIGLGRTVAAGLSAAEAYEVAAKSEGRIAVAAVNGPTATTLSGDPDSILEQVDDWSAEGTFARLLNVDVAFHGPQMDPLADELVESLAGLEPKPTTIPLVSTVTGEWHDGRLLDASYWGRNLRETVQFADATQTLADAGFDTFLEVGPHPSLVASILATLRASGRDGVALGSIRRDSSGPDYLLQSIAALHVRGASVRWSAVTPHGRFVRLPGYPWQRERFWATPSPAPLDHHHGNGNGNGNGNGHASNGRNRTSTPATNGAPSHDATADLLYEVVWQPVMTAGSSRSGSGGWLILADEGGVAEEFRSSLEARGERCRTIPREQATRLAEILTDLAAMPEESVGMIVSFWSLDALPLDPTLSTVADLEASLAVASGSALHLIQTLEAAGSRAKLWLVTAGAQAVGPDQSVAHPVQAMTWGLGRSARWDRGDAWGGLVDLDPRDPVGSVPGLVNVVMDRDGDDEQAIRDGQRFTARLVRSSRPTIKPATPVIRAEGTYLITGGRGDLGIQAADWLVEQGARRLILVGRSGLPPRAEWATLPQDHAQRSICAAIEGIERRGATVVVIAADVADEGRMRAVFDRVGEILPPIRGILHAAGVVGSTSLRETTPALWNQAIRPKVAGTWVLHRLAASLPLDFFVSFSSVAAIFGTKEVAYAAANHFLDAYASWAGERGVPAVSLSWGPWAGVGMAASLTRAHKILGFEPLPSDRAFEVLGQILGGERPASGHQVVADVDWFTFGVVRGGKPQARRFFEAIEERPRPETEMQTSIDRRAVDAWRAAPTDQRREQVIGYFRNRVAGVLRLDPDRVDPERKLDTLGLDSLMAIELKSGVEADLGTTLPITQLLEGPTIAELADCAIEQWTDDPEANASAPGPIRAHSVATSTGPEWHPLSPGQRSLWLVHQRIKDDAAYNMAGAARVQGDFDVATLGRCLQTLVNRHASLRTTFGVRAEGDGEPEQVVHPPGSIAAGFTVVDASGWSDTTLTERLTAEARRPFNLAAASPFRTTLFSRDGLDHHLVLSAHHIIGDFWSIALLMHELGTLYAADRAGTPAPIGEPAVSYTDFVRWQRDHLAGPAGDRLRTYWGEILRGPLPVLDLATDRPRPALRTQRGGTRSRLIDADLTSRLQVVGAESGASLYVTLLAAFQVLLGRLTGQTDVIVGSPVAGRDRAHLTDVVGYFANPLPIRSHLDGDQSFDSFLTQIRAAVFAGLDHQDLPFALMAEEFAGGRDPSRSPIFQAMFAFQKAQKLDEAGLTPFVLRGEGAKLTLGDFALESVAVDLAASQFELTLATAETDAGLATTLEYNSDLFDAATADRILARFETLLRSIVADSTTLLADLDLLPGMERDEVVVTPNQTAATIPVEPVHRLIERRAEQNPDAIAVAYRDVRLTYAELNNRSNRLARHLQNLGVGPESRVGLAVERSADMVVGILAIFKAGGAYVPLDPEYPRERLLYLLEDSAIRVLVTQSAVLDRLPTTANVVVLIDTTEPEWNELDGGNLVIEPDPANAAYVIYTSGSTGRPKGVVVTHRNLTHSTHSRSLHYRDPVQSFLLLASFAHDTSVAGLFWTLVDGGRLVIPVQGSHADPDSLTRLIAEHEVSHWNSVPSLLRVVLAEASPERMRSLRVIFLGGEACPLDLPDLVRAHLPQVELHNEYGPTEATVWCTVHVCEVDATGGSVPIGLPIANTEAYILDDKLRPVPVGVAGELYIGGVGVTRGYHERPALTAERFIPDPFGPRLGARLYRTGDLARWRGDGAIDFLGRIDHQVKVRGYRIELGEVEAALIRHPRLTDAVAVAREDQPGDVRLVAYFVPIADGGTALTPAELRRWLKEHLPDSLIPTVFVPIDALPLSPNGKVDRKALPTPADLAHLDQRDEPIIAPRNDAEATIAALASILLGRETLSIHDDFFDLGIDSIRAIQLVSRARQAGLALDPGQVFEYPSVAGLAAVAIPVPMEVAVVEEIHPDLAPTIGGGDLVDAYPLSPTQAGMLYHSASDPGSGVYVQQFTAPMETKLNIAAFEAAWRQVIARHPVLRTSFTGWDSGEGRQLVHRSVPLPLDHRDWSHLNSAERAGRLADFLDADRNQGFDPSQAPLLRLCLIRTGPAGFQLVLSNHHALMDGWCAPIILAEVLACYEANLAGHSLQLPPTRPYRDYIDHLVSIDQEATAAYWIRELRGFREPTPLPMTRAIRPTHGRDRGASPFLERSTVVSADLVTQLGQMARRHRLTLNTVLAGAWALVLGRYSGRDDVVFGVTVSGRPAELPGIESMVGLFINTLPARVELDEDLPLADWLHTLQTQLVSLRRHQSTPLIDVQRWSEMPRGRALFQTIFVFENTPDDPAAHARARRLGVGPLTVFERTNFPLTLTVVPGESLTMTARFDGDQIEAPSVDRLFDHLLYLLREMSDNPGASLAELALADAAETTGHPVATLISNDSLSTSGDDDSPLLSRLDGLSDEEVDALLARITSEQGIHP